MFQWHGADEQAPGWELELELAGNAQGLAEPCCASQGPRVPPCCPPGHWGRVSVPSLPTWAHAGVWDRQTESLQLPKAQPSWSLEPALSLGSSLEAPLGIPWVWAGLGGVSVALGPCLMRVRVGGKWLHSHLAPMVFIPGGAAVPWLCHAGRGAGLSLGGLCSRLGLAAGPGSLACQCRLWQGETPAVLHTQSQPGEGS